MRRFTKLLALVVCLAAAAVFATGALAGGNSANAKLCQKDGWQTAQSGTGGSFLGEEDCVAYGARSGMVFRPSLVASPTTVVEDQGIDLDGSGFHPSAPIEVSIVLVGGGSIVLPGVTNASGGVHFTNVFTKGACANGITGAEYTVTDSFGLHASAAVQLACA